MVEALLGVESSLSGKKWLAREGDERTALALSQRLYLPEIVGRVLTGRGVGLEEAETFLNPTLRDLLPDPSHLLDMDKACERLASAIMQGEKIAIFGDYDVDGATSSAVLTRFFDAVGAKSTIYVPDRIREGYGPNTEALLRLREKGASVVITVDCGTLSFEPLMAADKAGLDVIVVDHHAAEPKLPKAVAVINPNRIDEDSPHGTLAAVGVVFLLVVGLNRQLRDAGWFNDKPAPDLMALLDLVALGTICDVVPLIGVNRALVIQGLKVMANRGNIGLKALADVAGMDETPGAYHAGFVLGPRINAGGRVGKSDLGARLLSTQNEHLAHEISMELDRYNRERQDIEARVLDTALAEAEAMADGPVIVVAGENWHPGVVGIVASRLKDKYHRPSLVLNLNGDLGTGSGRSIPGVDLGAAVIAALGQGLLVKGGGHAMAAGFTVERNKIEAFRTFLSDHLSRKIKEVGTQPVMKIDGLIAVSGVTVKLIQELEKVGPFGAGNPEPRFVIEKARIGYADRIGQDQSHIKLALEGEGGGGSKRLDAIAFRAAGTDMGKALLHHDGAPFHLAGKIRLNRWQGYIKPQLLIDDAAPCW